MARFSSLGADGPFADDRTRLHCFERFLANRCEEVNNYSGRMTRSFCDGSDRFTCCCIDILQDRIIPRRITGRVRMDTVDDVMFGHGRQCDKPRPLGQLARASRFAGGPALILLSSHPNQSRENMTVRHGLT
jgi:hypothetical protein